MINEKPFNVIKAECPEVYKWLIRISRFSKVEDFIIPNYKNGTHIRFYTKEHSYSISIKPKTKESDGYLGCIAQRRKPIAGEDWTRGRDLADGNYSEATWDRILADIIAFELVKVAKPKDREAYLDKGGVLRPSNDSSEEQKSVDKK